MQLEEARNRTAKAKNANRLQVDLEMLFRARKLLVLTSNAHPKRQARKIRVKKEIEERGKLVKAISERGFEFPPVVATQVGPGHTFSGKVDPTDSIALFGETIRAEIKKHPPTNEKQVRKIGRRIRKVIETPEVKRLTGELGAIRKEVDVLYRKRKRLISEERATPSNSTELLEKLQAKQKKVYQQILEKTQQAQPLISELTASKQSSYLELMSSIRDMGSTNPHPVAHGSDSEVVRHINEAQRFLPSDWLKEFHKSSLQAIRSNRGSYNGKSLKLTPDSNFDPAKSTVLHEMWHRAEHLIPGIAEREKELFNRRTKNSKEREMSRSVISRTLDPTNKPEYTKRNRWGGHKRHGSWEYMGRVYEIDFFEVGTMGIEGAVHSTYHIENDPEVYELVLGLLATQ